MDQWIPADARFTGVIYVGIGLTADIFLVTTFHDAMISMYNIHHDDVMTMDDVP